MYICVCNALRQSQIEALVREGLRCEKQIYRRLGCRPQCGTCLPVARALIREAAPQPA